MLLAESSLSRDFYAYMWMANSGMATPHGRLLDISTDSRVHLLSYERRRVLEHQSQECC